MALILSFCAGGLMVIGLDEFRTHQPWAVTAFMMVLSAGMAIFAQAKRD